MFAELGIAHLLVADGWQARWVCTYGRPKMDPLFLTDWNRRLTRREQVSSEIDDSRIRGLLDGIACANGKFGGCWDVVAWKDRRLLFLESKLLKKDRIQDSQIRWLLAGLEAGLRLDHFMVIEWSYT
jgi:hypothetical protein